MCEVRETRNCKSLVWEKGAGKLSKKKNYRCHSAAFRGKQDNRDDLAHDSDCGSVVRNAGTKKKYI